MVESKQYERLGPVVSKMLQSSNACPPLDLNSLPENKVNAGETAPEMKTPLPNAGKRQSSRISNSSKNTSKATNKTSSKNELA